MDKLMVQRTSKMLLQAVCIVLCGLVTTEALNNGLALTPPMGWLSWLRFGCNIDCNARPKECISDRLIRRMADLMVSEGYVAAGYQYITIDDCWLERERSPEGLLVPDRKRFPNGMKALADYVHSKGMKFGMYEDIGTKTCEGYPGLQGYELYDADTLCQWDIDYLKVDGCYADINGMSEGYPRFGQLLNATGRPVLYACSWPFFQEVNNVRPNYTAVSENCNIWRNWYDIRNSWSSVLATMTWLGDNQERLAPFAGPGHWNDPDMLVIGNSGLTVDQAEVQMAIWSILAAPLMMSVELDGLLSEFKQILLNREVIAINQDKLGIQGSRVWRSGDDDERPHLEIWHRKLSGGARALAFVNRHDQPTAATFTHEEMKLPQKDFTVQDLFNPEKEHSLEQNENLTLRIKATGVMFFKFIPV